MDAIDRNAVELLAKNLEDFDKVDRRTAEKMLEIGEKNYSNWNRGRADGYALAAKWLRRDILGEEVE